MIKGKDTEIADNIDDVAVDRDIAIIDEFGKNYTPEQRQNFFRSYNEMKGKVSPTKFATYYDMTFQYGLQNLGVQSAMKNSRIKNVLSTDALGRAYSAGYLEFKENLKHRASNIRKSNNKGSVKFDNVHKEMLNDTQKAAVGVAEILSDVTGVNYEIFESQKDENGKYKGENGSYNRSTNTIRIDVNAGMKNSTEGNNIMVVTLAHELTHYIEELSPEHYATLQEFAFNKLAEVKGQDINELIYLEENRIKRNREQNNMKPFSKSELTEMAKSELVARSFEGMLTDKESIRELAKKDTGLFNKIKEKVLDFVKKIEKACSEILGTDGKYKKGTVSEEAYVLQKYAKEMREMWNEALKEAGENEKTITQYKEVILEQARFCEEIDKWNQNNRRKTFVLGRTSKVLKSIKVKDKNIIMHSSKMLKILHDHPEMNKDLFKEIPQILDKPIIVMESLTQPGSLVVYGDVVANNGKAVMCVLKMEDNKEQIVLSDFVVANAFGKDNPQHLLNTSEIYYVEPDIKRTNSWLKRFRLQLPAGFNQYGSIKTVSYNYKESNQNLNQDREILNDKYEQLEKKLDDAKKRLWDYEDTEKYLEYKKELNEARKGKGIFSKEYKQQAKAIKDKYKMVIEQHE